MIDTLDIEVKVTPYKTDPNYDLDLDNPVHVSSVFGHKELVRIEHHGHEFFINGAELEKAINVITAGGRSVAI